ncbi:transglycosylase domain-containing protein [Luteolibacter arcticus]|uniref:peptidoglycan glycosyltransferase n=1 Tax=Luteolibacter arcticus TaxID=1581411 RepID=A0ABT3GEW9_9BACT|nr:transglycosylase domain-containing protein [Luteolibacter arcticus]MCW1922154.1 transglycosylase domain-containing protein [Luteolibacter arcticus]
MRRKRVMIPAVLLAAGLFAWFVLPWCVPLPAGLTEVPASPVLLDRNGKPLHHLVLPDFTRSAPVSLAEVPADLIACTIAAEDKRFRQHGGIDLLATARAAKDAVLHRRAVSGASTITQQLIKLSSPPAKRDLRTKVREALLARHLEMKWSKDQILVAYLNRLPYGNHRTGPAEAARFYFQKPLADLSLGESALLAGLPQAPSRLNPVKHSARALARRDIVLHRLAKNYDTSRTSAARSEALTLRPLPEKEVAPWLPSFDSGLPITRAQTTIDVDLQGDLEGIVGEELAKLAGSHIKHAAVVVLDNETREILALVSSGDWNDPNGGQINGALTPRSPGSALKPFTWLLAIEKGGLHPASIVADIPTRFRTKEGLDAPENYDRTFRGPVSVREALACSLNVPAMRALNDIGGVRPLHELLLELGIDTIGSDPTSYGLGLTLGNAPVRLLDLTNAYATLAEGGKHRQARLWMANEADADSSSAISLPPSAISAFLIADILADPIARAPSFGRAGPLELPFRCAAKTGTSSDFRDNWCLGFTRDFTVGVWAGNFDNSPMKGVSGVAGAGPIFHAAMVRLHRDRKPQWLERPEGLVAVAIDPLTGKRIADGGWQMADEKQPDSTTFPVAIRHLKSPLSLIQSDRLPLFASTTDRDSSGRVLLDSSYAEWFASSYNRRRDVFALAEGMPAEAPLRILAPRHGMTYVLDPELPNGGVLHLATNLPGEVVWSCKTLEVSSGGTEAVAKLKPGSHILIATDKRTGVQHDVTIKVEQR